MAELESISKVLVDASTPLSCRLDSIHSSETILFTYFLQSEINKKDFYKPISLSQSVITLTPDGQNGTAALQPIVTGIETEDVFEVLESLELGDEVILSRDEGIQEGAKVK